MSGDNPLCNLRVSRADAEARISERISLGQEMLTALEQLWREASGRTGYENPPTPEHAKGRASFWSDYSRWDEFNKTLLERLFDSAKIAAEYNAPRESEASYGVFLVEIENLQNNVKADLQKLRSIKDRLPLFEPARAVSASQNASDENEQVIFVVHGRNEEVLAKTELLLEKLCLKHIVLRDQVESGSPTLIAKFERHAKGARYAVILMTGDDEGRCMQGSEPLSPRARQNVILELGFFVGTLTRAKVCVLYEGGVEKPSDILGVEHIPLDVAGKWKHTLSHKLHAAGFNVELRKVV